MEENRNMENCPVCGEKLVIIAGYTMPNFCRHCDRLIITEEMEEREETR